MLASSSMFMFRYFTDDSSLSTSKPLQFISGGLFVCSLAMLLWLWCVDDTQTIVRLRPRFIGFINWFQFMLFPAACAFHSLQDFKQLNLASPLKSVAHFWMVVFRLTLSAEQTLLPAVIGMALNPFFMESLLDNKEDHDSCLGFLPFPLCVFHPGLGRRLVFNVLGFAASFSSLLMVEHRFRWFYLLASPTELPSDFHQGNHGVVLFSITMIKPVSSDSIMTQSILFRDFQDFFQVQSSEIYNMVCVETEETLVISGVLNEQLCISFKQRMFSSFQENSPRLICNAGWVSFARSERKSIELFVFENGVWCGERTDCPMQLSWTIPLCIVGIAIFDTIFMW
mmetsp:Transcript_2316/g.3209  ORF Transcript_2316/g.3209 Transcript_2316/m.3209 type:complete len:340 (+) Transcript_2316:193-1212(+)